MTIEWTLNGKALFSEVNPFKNVQEFLKEQGVLSVRDSDDHAGFTGSDTILLDGKAINAGLLIAGQLDGHSVETVESLNTGNKMGYLQAALVDAGAVQSGYNAGAAALILKELLERVEKPTEEDIRDAYSGLFVRDFGYMALFKAVELALAYMDDPEYTHGNADVEIAPEFRKDLREVGTPRRKVDGAQLIMGRKAFVEDRVDPEALHMKVLRSSFAHAYITSIDVSMAKSLPGVLSIITHENCPDVYYGSAGQGFPEPSPYDKRMFNRKIRHAGDRIAAVVAESEQIALDALALIHVEYEALPVVMSIDEAKAPDAPIVQNGVIKYEAGAPDDLDAQNKDADERDGEVIYQFPIGGEPHKNIASYVEGGIGDVDKGFAGSDVVLEREYESSQIQCTPLEPHSVYTKMEGDRLVIHASTQVPWHLRRIVARVLGIKESNIHVIKERVGGGYGSKQDILLEELASWVTWQTGKSVYYRYSRKEEFTSNSTRHVMRIKVKIGAMKDGTMTAIDMTVEANTGPFGNHCLTVPMNACSKSLPLFLCDHFHFDVTTYYSNIAPTGAYQGYGAPKGSYALQMAVAELAEELGIDPLELIEKNRVREGSMLEILKCLGEGREGSAARVESCGLDGALEKGAELIEWGKKEISHDPDVKIGKGVVIIQQGSGLPGLDHSNAEVKLLTDGTLLVRSGGADLGTGLDTMCVKIASEILTVPMNEIAIVSGDTDSTSFDTGAYASSGTYFSGNAVVKASENLKEKILKAASEMLKEPESDLVLELPSMVKGRKGSVSFEDISRDCLTGEGRGQLIGSASYTTEDSAFPYGAHFCQVAVNIKSGAIKLQKYYALQDCGTPINPELAMGQIYGGVMKSIGHTMYEEMVFDDRGRCINTDLRSYGVPMMGDVPEDFQVHLIQTDDPFGPFGGKSISEIAVNGAAPVIANAIHDACGVWLRTWPLTPEKILKGLGKI
ncbi:MULTISPECIES: molybdopterin-dependent oxidoreductase Mo/Fe-S-binding subunit [unclassified Oceanispirochaeta]|uniref:molybdopterin-dependent oxidoreductase Mo/Fe-S-binding subunit n=1 Tax=unclassified Oceanispirochaeta TaxID=2635722 RepID=UPI000E0953A0|nr:MULTISPECIES: molybdopterin-dependent oxidoreductase Mo/Fe-S-binding subunit [unclassified Oceanispirochaeta]MBF9014947.1 molybdopterin-dependent oxidoreductase Mo/Fe-S-binding subunit [Oceanispirochaeta sp. M2]NPD71372.1 molybdopterin-dependent oxidoreductase Mo/Fe-S-binding subunit [Oceanispirochaeta sp. M1]RDG33337.1 molybdopterin-dependent oxidoreductase Mo/Fe-S-binding subunit [Oceanispirochaeta sp. M1]